MNSVNNNPVNNLIDRLMQAAHRERPPRLGNGVLAARVQNQCAGARPGCGNAPSGHPHKSAFQAILDSHLHTPSDPPDGNTKAPGSQTSP
ncbi:MAG: hypothetical protein V1809_05525 [Planctomycetota bacterium]